MSGRASISCGIVLLLGWGGTLFAEGMEHKSSDATVNM